MNIPLKGRSFARSSGCYNCKHWDNDEKARKHWQMCKQRDLNLAKSIELTDPRGASAPKVMQIRKNVSDANFAMNTGKFGICLRGKAGADFCQHNFLCDGWDGRDGASVAREGGKLDQLPGELKAKVD